MEKHNFKHVISVNVAVLGGVRNDNAFYSKYIGNSCYNYWGKCLPEVKRMLSFGNVGRKLLAEDIARDLNVGYDLAKKILSDIEKAL
ncbi:hypothetical protein BIS47_190 [Klebsiella phage vB_KpnM_BIS47]|jgi:hypothetical protein|uniref:Uncharacterized protein n=1 Tax=Klebsiella phage vB_KpnM_BIS47 TaxID=1907784 RepID=A0A1V0E762_9CAUD|nr:hypothetical protein BIS47_190 [Klebsiella phage vB_KpnM_BIS47]YP_009966262.1 ran-binding protein 17 isoform X2 [Klebsiella phage KNP2]ARB12694.1 hypothetical protein BIS47_190 [Klebsiella phage vB_KpnM_BIS47]